MMKKDEIKREIISLVEAGGGAEVLYFMAIPSSDIAPEQYESIILVPKNRMIVGCLILPGYFKEVVNSGTIDRERKRKVELVAVSVAKKSLDKELGLVATYQLDPIQVLQFCEEDEMVEWTAPEKVFCLHMHYKS